MLGSLSAALGQKCVDLDIGRLPSRRGIWLVADKRPGPIGAGDEVPTISVWTCRIAVVVCEPTSLFSDCLSRGSARRSMRCPAGGQRPGIGRCILGSVETHQGA